MKTIQGNILLSDKDILVQQVNCKGFMGKGLAQSIMMRYPNVKKEYQKFRLRELQKGLKDEDLLGLVNFVDVYDGNIIANVFGQVNIRKGTYDKTVYTKKEALLKGIQQVEEKARELNLSVAIPTYIGCGLAGGDWTEIKQGIEEIFKNSPVEIDLYEFR
ncbi:macro domain-containing protein [Psychrobacillus sp. FSL K6-1464]|uniref:macro domain-containing protein n=1 Tax=Psychrobacillus sp. FSL K6-1464 TaxID=2921545 RepID=UPI0030F9C933